jgi:hypothetical protein
MYSKDLGHVDIMTGFARPLRNQKLVDNVDNFISNILQNKKQPHL